MQFVTLLIGLTVLKRMLTPHVSKENNGSFYHQMVFSKKVKCVEHELDSRFGPPDGFWKKEKPKNLS